MLFENVDKTKEPRITVTQQGVTNKPAIWFHQVDNGNTAVLCLSQQINDNLRIYIPNDATQYSVDNDGVKSVTLVTEESFNHWWQQVKNWLDSNLETTIVNWIEDHWDTQFQPHVDKTVEKYNVKMMNDNDNSLANNGNITYVNDPQQPRGVIPKIHDIINAIKSDLNTEISNRKSEDSAIRREILEQLPVGSLLHLYKSDSVNSDVRNWYLKCDGSLVPSGTQYDKLRSFLSGGNNQFSRCNNVFDNRDINNKSVGAMPQIGYMIGKALRERYRQRYGSTTLIAHPIPLSTQSAIELLNEYYTNNYASAVTPFQTNIPFWILTSNNFKSTSTGGLTDSMRGTYNRANNTYVVKSGNTNTTTTCSFYSSGWWRNAIYDPDGDMSSNQVERFKHCDLYNFQLHVRRIYSSGSYKTIQILLGQSDSWTSVWVDDLELTFNVDTQSGQQCDLLLYVEIGNRDTNRITQEYAILIPYEFIINGGNSNETTIKSFFKNISEVVDLTNGTPKYYGSQNYAGFTTYSSVLEFVIPNPTGSDWVYMRVGGLVQGRASNIRSSDNVYYPMLHPILSYVFENPLSYYTMMHGAYRRFDGYMNYNYFNKTAAGTALTASYSYAGYFNRFKINTDGFLKMLGLDDIYSIDQFKNFWDDMISNCKMKGWAPSGNKYASYPKRGGVDVYSLPQCSSSDPSGFSSRPAFSSTNTSWGCVYGFRSFDPRSTGYGLSQGSTTTKRDDIAIKGSRTVLRITDASNIYFAIDTNGTNIGRRNNRYGFMLHCNGTWKDLSYYLNKVTSQGNSYSANRMIGNNEYDSEFTWSNQYDSSNRCYESAGLCRIRIYNEGETDPWVDVMYTEFASNKNWEDGMGGSQGDYGGLGNGFTVLNSSDNILAGLQNPGSMNVNVIVVVDRITNLFNCYGGYSSSYTQWADAYDCFNVGWFIDYCNNDNKFLVSSEVRLPDLTKDGVFLGGGSMPGTFKEWTVPEIKGRMSAPYKGYYVCDGVFNPNGSANFNSTDGGGDPTYVGNFNLNNVLSYVGHNNKDNSMYSSHHVVETWMKFK